MTEEKSIEERARETVEEKWTETEKDGDLYGWYIHPKFTDETKEKLKKLLDDGVLTQNEYNTIRVNDYHSAGGVKREIKDGDIDKARDEIKQKCIEHEIKRLTEIELICHNCGTIIEEPGVCDDCSGISPEESP